MPGSIQEQPEFLKRRHRQFPPIEDVAGPLGLPARRALGPSNRSRTPGVWVGVVTVEPRQRPVRAWRRMWAVSVRWSIAALATSLGLVLGPGQGLAQASPGDLDPTFGTGGKMTTDFVGAHDQARALVVQADGNLVAAGVVESGGLSDFALARYTAR
jgi:hypothetical protein